MNATPPPLPPVPKKRFGLKATILLIVFVLFSVGLLAGLLQSRRVSSSAPIAKLQDQARRIQEAQIEEFKKTGSISNNTEAADQLIATMKDAGAKGDALNRKIMTAFADFLQKGRDGEAKHSEASERIDSAWILQPKTAKSIQEINAVAGAVTNFIQVNQDFLAYFTNGAVTLSENLKSKGVPSSQIQEGLRGFQASFRPQLPFIKKIREQDHEYGQTLLQILDLYKSEHGKWKWDEENEVATFEDKSSGERWFELMGDVNDIAEEQRKTQGELIDVRAKNLTRPPR